MVGARQHDRKAVSYTHLLERIDSYQNRTYKAHGRALLRMAEILKETEAPAVKGSKRQ